MKIIVEHHPLSRNRRNAGVTSATIFVQTEAGVERLGVFLTDSKSLAKLERILTPVADNPVVISALSVQVGEDQE